MSNSLSEFAVGVVFLSVIMMTLVIFALLARKLLLLTGNARLSINNSQPHVIELGRTLLMVLADKGIHLRASCGGKGVCGQCQVKVVRGNTPLSQLETGHITQEQAGQGIRLACMLRINGDLSIEVSDTLTTSKQYHYRVVSNRLVSTYLTELCLEPENGAGLSFEAGDYILLEAPPCSIKFRDFQISPKYLSEWEKFGLLDLKTEIREKELRAYSLANAPSEGKGLQLLIRIATPPAQTPVKLPAGKVSSYIFSLKQGDPVSVNGPFGLFHCRDIGNEMLFIGGGAGMAPLRSMIREQLIGKNTKQKLSFWYGARSKQQVCYQTEFEKLKKEYDNFDWYIALSEPLLDDNWDGPVGFIHQVVLQSYLCQHSSPKQIDYYICGPPLMSAATITMLKNLGVKPDNIFNDDFSGSA